MSDSGIKEEERCPGFKECSEFKPFYWGFCIQKAFWVQCPLFNGKFNPSSRFLGMETYLNHLQLEKLAEVVGK